MIKNQTIDSFFKKRNSQDNTSTLSNLIESSIVDNETSINEEEHLTKAL